MYSKKAFTLIELLVVLIIIGVLATAGTLHYFKVVEKSRSAEAAQVMSTVRSLALAHWNEYSALDGTGGTPVFDNAAAGIGSGAGEIPDTASSSHYFTYAVSALDANTVETTATRCSDDANCKGGVMAWGGAQATLQTTCPDGIDVPNCSSPCPWR